MNEGTNNKDAVQATPADNENAQVSAQNQAGDRAEEKNAETPAGGSSDSAPASASGSAPAEAPAEAPAGTTTPQALFDMAPKKKEEPKKPAAGAGTKTPARPEPQKYPEGYEVRYGREAVHLPKEMTPREVLAWMGEDDYPELKYEEVEVRHDKDKNRLVVVRKAQKKGSDAPSADPAVAGAAR